MQFPIIVGIYFLRKLLNLYSTDCNKIIWLGCQRVRIIIYFFSFMILRNVNVLYCVGNRLGTGLHAKCVTAKYVSGFFYAN